MADKAIHVIFELPSGSRADVTFYNRPDARYLMEAVKRHAKFNRMPPPQMIQYSNDDQIWGIGNADTA